MMQSGLTVYSYIQSETRLHLLRTAISLLFLITGELHKDYLM